MIYHSNYYTNGARCVVEAPSTNTVHLLIIIHIAYISLARVAASQHHVNE